MPNSLYLYVIKLVIYLNIIIMHKECNKVMELSLDDTDVLLIYMTRLSSKYGYRSAKDH